MPDDGQYLQIAAQSGRALAAAARRAGYVPLVADVFGDSDTLALAARHVMLPVDGQGGIARGGFLAVLETLAGGVEPVGLVCGSGFEDRTALLTDAAMRWPLLGNNAEIVQGLKNPQRFAGLCEKLGIAHPTITFAVPRDLAGWLVKQAGASGGAHVRAAARTDVAQPGRYFQRAVSGLPVSVLLCGDGRHARVLGMSMQWASPVQGAPFRYGGAAGPLDVAPAIAAQMTQAVQKLVQARRLRGLCSADFVVADGFVWLLEINPRPGATLDVFDCEEQPLLRHHLAGCAGTLLPAPPRPGGARAAAIAYTDCAIAAMPAIDWPDWTADRQAAFSPLTDGAPLCTVLGSGATPDSARAVAMDRIARIKTAVDGNV